MARSSWDAATKLAAEKFSKDKKDFVILASGRLSNEDLFNLKTLADHAGGKAYLYSHMAARTMVRKHTNSKGARPAQARADTSWMARRYAIVTLLAGRVDIFDQWAGWINNADLPPNVSLWVSA